MKINTLFVSLILLTACNDSTNTTNNDRQKQNTDLIFKDSLGHTISLEDLNAANGKLNFELKEDKKINPEAQALHNEARTLGQSGNYDQSIKKLNEAIKIQPDWAYPYYDLAYTYLLKSDFEKAVKFYQKTDSLEPKGFFTAKTALYALQGEEIGKFPKGIYLSYLQIEWTESLAKKMEIARTLTEKFPDFAPAWKELSVLLDNKEERMKAIEKGLSKHPDAETEGILLINKAVILSNSGKTEEVKQILGKMIFSEKTTLSTLQLAKLTLKSIVEH